MKVWFKTSHFLCNIPLLSLFVGILTYPISHLGQNQSKNHPVPEMWCQPCHPMPLDKCYMSNLNFQLRTRVFMQQERESEMNLTCLLHSLLGWGLLCSNMPQPGIYIGPSLQGRPPTTLSSSCKKLRAACWKSMRDHLQLKALLPPTTAMIWNVKICNMKTVRLRHRIWSDR